jgi:D-hydroxyproline dehydrogenase subunit beta
VRRTADVVVVGAGAVGAACAYFLVRAGLAVHVVERGSIAAGVSSACEGNLLVSDKEAGPELDLALYSRAIWDAELAEHRTRWEFEPKGGLVVVASELGVGALARLAARQRQAGIEVRDVTAEELPSYEPHLSRSLLAGAFYPQDAQVQPMLLVAHLLQLARELGATVETQTPVTGMLRDGDRVTGVQTVTGTVSAGAVLNAAGPWASEVARLAGVEVSVLPRRGFVLVTQPLPLTVHHKVYAGEYVANVLSPDSALQTAPVVEGTRGGTILIGSSRERVGFDRSVSLPVLGALAREAVSLFPVLATAKVMRSYLGFRPYCPDHLPVIGADSRAPGLWHASGHEGAGIGLSVGTGKLLAQAITGVPTDLSLTPFAPERFANSGALSLSEGEVLNA